MQTLWWLHNQILRYIHKKRFSVFLSRFLRICSQSSKKVQIWPKKKLFWQKSYNVSKTQNFTLILNLLKKLWKIAPKKVISKTSLTNMSKNEKSAFFHHIFANYFFLVHFFKTFLMDSKSAWNSAFFDTFFDFKKN